MRTLFSQHNFFIERVFSDFACSPWLRYHEFQFGDAKECLKHRWLFFIGDSLAREQLYVLQSLIGTPIGANLAQLYDGERENRVRFDGFQDDDECSCLVRGKEKAKQERILFEINTNESRMESGFPALFSKTSTRSDGRTIIKVCVRTPASASGKLRTSVLVLCLWDRRRRKVRMRSMTIFSRGSKSLKM